MCAIILSRNVSFKNSFLFNRCNKLFESEIALDHLFFFKYSVANIYIYIYIYIYTYIIVYKNFYYSRRLIQI